MSESTTPQPSSKASINKTVRLKNNLWFAYIVLLILWGYRGYALLGTMIHQHQFFAVVIDNHPYVSDFVNVYNSASLAAACQKEKIDIYSPSLQAEYEKKLTAPVVAEQPFYLQYPPFLFALVRPLAFFDMLSAWMVWCSMGMALLIVSALYLTRSGAEAGASSDISADAGASPDISAEVSSDPTSAAGSRIFGVSRFTLAFVIVATLASFPTWLSIKLGQTSLLLVPGLAAFWLFCQRRRYFYAGLASGVVMIKLQYLPPLFLIGFILGRWPYLGGFTLVGLALLALSILTLGLDNVMHFPQALLKGENSQGVSGVAADQMQNLRGNLTIILGNDNAMVHIISIFAFAVALAVLAFLWWRAAKTWWRVDNAETSKSSRMSRFRVLASISTMIMLVVSPHCHTQDYLALVIPCIWLWFEIAKLKASGKIGKEVTFLQGMVLLFPLLGWPFFVLLIFFHLAKIQPFFLWAVIAIILSCSLYVQMQRQAEKSNI